MAVELSGNDFQTTLSAAVTSTGATSISVAAPAPAELQGGQFRVRVDNEIMLVTATGASGASPWTVSRAVEPVAGVTAAALHSLGAAVNVVWTAAFMDGKRWGMPTPPTASYMPGGNEQAADEAFAQTGTYLRPTYLPAGTLDRIGCYVQTAGTTGCVVRLGLYRHQGARFGSGVLVGDYGTVDATTTGYKEISISQVLTAADALYYLVANAQGAPATTCRLRIAPGGKDDGGTIMLDGGPWMNGWGGLLATVGQSGALASSIDSNVQAYGRPYIVVRYA